MIKQGLLKTAKPGIKLRTANGISLSQDKMQSILFDPARVYACIYTYVRIYVSVNILGSFFYLFDTIFEDLPRRFPTVN